VASLACLLWLGAATGACADETAAGKKPSDGERLFLTQIKPLLQSRCLSCHSPDQAEGGLRLDSRDALLAGGASGPAILPGDADASLLVMAVARTHAALEMPPQETLEPSQVLALARWVDLGAPWVAAPPAGDGVRSEQRSERLGDAWSDPRNPIVQLFGGDRLDLWSLRKVVRPEIPPVKDSAWAKGDLDRFVLARLERDGLPPRPLADGRTIARRLYFDLTGLPPTPEQSSAFVEEFQRQGADAAVGALIDQLLASPRYGEHFARLWLDVVRYSDSNGFDWDEFRPGHGDFATMSCDRSTPISRSTALLASSWRAMDCSTVRRAMRPSGIA
jgi:hypothetical protein